jgi:hypothetical protein
LWVAIVNGEPVKPVEPTTAAPGLIRIPLIKTAQGEGDYPVILKYGGRITEVRELTQVNFPLIKVVNLSVERTTSAYILNVSPTGWNSAHVTAGAARYDPRLCTTTNNWSVPQLQRAATITPRSGRKQSKKIELTFYSYRAASPNETTVLDVENEKLLKEGTKKLSSSSKPCKPTGPITGQSQLPLVRSETGADEKQCRRSGEQFRYA